MGKKKHVLGSLFFKGRDSSPEGRPPSPYSSSSWPWHSCKHPKTASFRYCLNDDSGITCSSSSAASEEEEEEEEEPVVVRRRRSDRLFFDAGGDTSSIMEEAKATATAASVGEEKEPPFEDSVAVAVESRNPYSDFRRSMEEVVAAQGLGAGDWERMEELLAWYLCANSRKTHGFIVGAFLDLLAAIASSSSSASASASASASSPFSSSSSSASNSFKIKQLTEEEASEPRELSTPPNL